MCEIAKKTEPKKSLKIAMYLKLYQFTKAFKLKQKRPLIRQHLEYFSIFWPTVTLPNKANNLYLAALRTINHWPKNCHLPPKTPKEREAGECFLGLGCCFLARWRGAQ
ncbi:MAG: hypothetical protein A2527_14295 [Candidatus Lambdaproteobacteria bacterium RIFOXYD2_FULL_50_16]|uniref:Uncharacterized protein n=1 Tax=Candidatus Lambdaproteobacteria bacterium RIFOXYD2_FULL_50_16 TaxID=1817772 RepID=A0A1F6G4Q4_9PROT|nr:MAG: hypothetical protein A2527_14295 [Candidatus Lambdaproteobacteria bacterium RIFOXYD2_FULL_50_16]